MKHIYSTTSFIAQKRRAKAMATKDAKKAGTKTEASEVGAGAGAPAAETPLTAESAMSMTIINATANIFIFMASISAPLF